MGSYVPSDKGTGAADFHIAMQDNRSESVVRDEPRPLRLPRAMSLKCIKFRYSQNPRSTRKKLYNWATTFSTRVRQACTAKHCTLGICSPSRRHSDGSLLDAASLQ